MDSNDEQSPEPEEHAGVEDAINAFRRSKNVILMSDFSKMTANMGEEEFYKAYNHPFLVLLTPLKNSANNSHIVTHGTDVTSLRNLLDSPIFFVVKQPERNVFEGMITVGRTNNNDIAIPWSKLSKFHAYFSQKGDEWFITDYDSSNGTYINRQLIDPQKPHLLEQGSVDLAFSKSLAFFFMGSAGMHRYMTYMRRISNT
jgi:hypothetical protein